MICVETAAQDRPKDEAHVLLKLTTTFDLMLMFLVLPAESEAF